MDKCTPAQTSSIPPINLPAIFLLYLRLGLTGFGATLAAETKKHLVKRRCWISEADFVNGLALAQLLPGATFVSLTVYIGFKLRGLRGALAAFTGFLVPPGDETALAEKLRCALEHAEETRKMGQQAHLFARQFFSPEKYVAGYAELVNAATKSA